MNKAFIKLLIIIGLLCLSSSFALSGKAYMERFNTYLAWYQRIPIHPSPEFLAFVKESTPLANKLRDKWLYELARIKDWPLYNSYYQPSNDINLVCYKRMAEFATGQQELALKNATPIWLTGESLTKPCTMLFDVLLKEPKFNSALITKRLTLALDKNNLQLVNYLLKLNKKNQPQQPSLLLSIFRNPIYIIKLNKHELNGYFYLYGLKRLISTNMDKALKLWADPKTKTLLNANQQQDFIAQVALYKAMRNNADALVWYAKLPGSYYNDLVLEWQIRFALKNGMWKKAAELINHSKNKDTPIWQYWLARCWELQGKKNEAKTLYENLAKTRNYYGFLASQRLKQKPQFENELPSTNLDLLKPYLSVINQIQALYNSKKIVEASRLLNDFISELPKNEASALVYWIDTKLHWHGKSIYLSSNEVLTNQLNLRFPLAYEQTIRSYAKKYALPPEFIYSIIRQESSFREDVVSSAGAKGLMQVMPFTAYVVSKADRIPYKDSKELFLSQKNINIGTAYLKQLAKRFNNHPILVAAAYNAGPRQVVYWLKNHSPNDIDLWIETLPWQETRNYLKNIIAFNIVYQYRLNQKPNLNLFLSPLHKE